MRMLIVGLICEAKKLFSPTAMRNCTLLLLTMLVLGLGKPTDALAAPAFQAAGTAVTGTGNVNPAWPTHAIDDLALLFVEKPLESRHSAFFWPIDEPLLVPFFKLGRRVSNDSSCRCDTSRRNEYRVATPR